MQMMDRRRWMANAGLVGLGLAAGSALTACASVPGTASSKPFFTPGDERLGVQLYALAPELDADFDGTLARLSRLGIRSVELAGFHDREAAQLRASFDRAGLQCTSAHITATPLRSGPSFESDLDLLARDMHAIGVTDVVLPVPLFRGTPTTAAQFKAITAAMTLDDWKRTAAFLGTVGREMHKRDLRIGYHNHDFDFISHDGTTGLDLLLRETDPALVAFELDAGWASSAGIDPVLLMRAHPGRFTQMHVKDIKRAAANNAASLQMAPAEVGSGIMNWPEILAAADAAGVRRYYIEQEPPYTGPRIDSVAKSTAYLLTVKPA